MTKTCFAIPLAYPDTIVMISSEWYVKYLHYLGVGKRNYVKAGHAALVLVEKESGLIEYFDFGRYITPEPYGRVRSAITDNELQIPFKAIIENDTIVNIDAILQFFVMQPKLTHGEGRMIASIKNEVNYVNAKRYIEKLQDAHFIKYAAFKKDGTNCARFVTDTLLASVEDKKTLKKLKKTKLFTPSPIGNVLAVKGKQKAYQVSETGKITIFKNSKQKEILNCFLDTIDNHQSTLKGTLQPLELTGLSKNAQWLSGIGSGAWLELFKTENLNEYLFKRTSAFGNVDVCTVFKCEDTTFNINDAYVFNHKSHCNSLMIKQKGKAFLFQRVFNSVHVAH